MGFLYLLISIIGESAAKTIDKLNFRRNRINPRHLILLIFFAMSATLSLYIFLTKQPFPHFTFISLSLVALIAVLSFGGNALDYVSLQKDDLSLREPLCDFEPIVAGLVGYALFPAERRPGFLLAFLVGAIIVYYGTHRRKLRRLQRKGMFYYLLAVCLYGVLPSVYKESLYYLSPAYIAWFRVVSVLILSTMFLPVKNVRKLSSKKLSYGLLAGSIYAVGAVASLYAIRDLGVVLTMLLSLLGPALRYWSGYFILRENVRVGEMVSSILLAIAVLVPVLH